MYMYTYMITLGVHALVLFPNISPIGANEVEEDNWPKDTTASLIPEPE